MPIHERVPVLAWVPDPHGAALALEGAVPPHGEWVPDVDPEPGAARVPAWDRALDAVGVLACVPAPVAVQAPGGAQVPCAARVLDGARVLAMVSAPDDARGPEAVQVWADVRARG